MMGDRLSQWSGLSRDVDPSLRTHQVILATAATAGIGLAGYAWTAEAQPLPLASIRGLIASAGVFMTWVIGRELDPDHPWSAWLGALFSLPMLAALGLPNVLLAFWAVLLLRIVNRSTGLGAGPVDSLALLGLSAWMAYDLHPALLLFAALAMVLDGTMAPGHGPHMILGGGFALVAVALIVLLRPPLQPIDSLPFLSALAGGSTLYFGIALTQSAPRSVGDFSGENLSEARVRAAQALAPAIGWSLVLILGQGAVQGGAPFWAAILGMVAYHLPGRLSSARSEAADRKIS